MQSPAPISILLNEGIYLIKELNLCNNKRKKKYFQHVLWDKLNQRYPDTLIYRIPHLNILLRVLEGGGRTSGSYPVEQQEGSKEGALTHLGKPALAGSNNINDSVQGNHHIAGFGQCLFYSTNEDLLSLQVEHLLYTNHCVISRS